MKGKITRLLALVFICFFVVLQDTAFGQNALKVPEKEHRKNRPTFVEVGLGWNRIVFRDFATSPLFYTGLAQHVSLAPLKEK